MYLTKLIQFKNQNKRIAIIGLGAENLQFLKWLIDVVNFPTKNIILADKNTSYTVDQQLEKKLQTCTKYLGPDYLDCLSLLDLEWVVKAPGIYSLKPELSSFRQINGQDSVTSSLVFFIEKFNSKIIGITGTKGKSTTSSLLTFLLKNLLNYDVEYCGNTTGISPYLFWNDLNLEIKDNNFWVIELSSFQLQDLGFCNVSPFRSVITNYYIDHQDQHRTAAEYWRAKDNIFLYSQGLLVANSQIQGKSNLKDILKDKQVLLISNDDVLNLSQNINFHLPGQHNLMNLVQALAVCANLENSKNVSLEKVQSWITKNQVELNKILLNFRSLPHRYQQVRAEKIPITVNEVSKQLNLIWVDDGYATEPDAVAAAVNSVSGKLGNYLWLWLAGFDKGSNLEVIIQAILEKQIQSKLYSVEYCGFVGQRALTELYTSVGSSQAIGLVTLKDSMALYHQNLNQISLAFVKWLGNQLSELKLSSQEQAFSTLNQLEEYTLHIVFSPAGSSFDEFKNAEERATWWTDTVKKTL